jgi:hypothetical protein
MQTIPLCSQTGAPIGLLGRFHFTSSVISGSASWMIVRSLARVSPRQSVVLAIMSSMSSLGLGILPPDSGCALFDGLVRRVV